MSLAQDFQGRGSQEQERDFSHKRGARRVTEPHIVESGRRWMVGWGHTFASANSLQSEINTGSPAIRNMGDVPFLVDPTELSDGQWVLLGERAQGSEMLAHLEYIHIYIDR